MDTFVLESINQKHSQKILDDFKELKDYAFEYGGSAQEQRVENLRLLVEKELNKIF